MWSLNNEINELLLNGLEPLITLNDITTTTSALYASGRNTAEYYFWLSFFKNSPMLQEFKRRVNNSNGFIYWDFIRPNDSSLADKSMSEQYREALQYAEDCIRDPTSHIEKTITNLEELEQRANEVISGRLERLKAHENDTNKSAQEIHKEIYRKWLELWQAINDTLNNLKAQTV